MAATMPIHPKPFMYIRKMEKSDKEGEMKD
ncbi:hypothetical protein ALC56_09770 [Trachymyrmex septentrionalis]|uniref:Uncharacterized protein n=1 Tax=Trachymyrmex septentrionalis TaxID=34720 RepID=A0A195F7D3_9HYME|nr:hypothetical protein ALC56_09770 [Trachymyrmex septentrionalis]